MNRVVLFVTNFGTNFSGGSLATHEIFNRLRQEMDVVVLCSQCGHHQFENAQIHVYTSWLQAVKLILQFRNSFFYSDFYPGVLLTFLPVSFGFTYHDNWPEVGQGMPITKRTFHIWAYRRIFTHARWVVSVSKFKLDFIRRYTSKVTLIKNGFMDSTAKGESIGRILMVGTLDSRKYQMAVALFQQFPEVTQAGVDVYGRIQDKEIARKLEAINGVHLRGFQDRIPYASYRMLLHCSQIENLPIVYCEAVSARIPVVAFDVGGSKEIVNEQNGRLIPAYDLAEMADTVGKLLSGLIRFDMQKDVLAPHDWELATKRYRDELDWKT